VKFDLVINFHISILSQEGTEPYVLSTQHQRNVWVTPHLTTIQKVYTPCAIDESIHSLHTNTIEQPYMTQLWTTRPKEWVPRLVYSHSYLCRISTMLPLGIFSPSGGLNFEISLGLINRQAS